MSTHPVPPSPLDTPEHYLQRMRSHRAAHRIHVFIGHTQAILEDETYPAELAVSRMRLCLEALKTTEDEPDYGGDVSPGHRLILDGFTESIFRV